MVRLLSCEMFEPDEAFLPVLVAACDAKTRYVGVYVCMCVCMCVCMYVCMYVCMCVYVLAWWLCGIVVVSWAQGLRS